MTFRSHTTALKTSTARPSILLKSPSRISTGLLRQTSLDLTCGLAVGTFIPTRSSSITLRLLSIRPVTLAEIGTVLI